MSKKSDIIEKLATFGIVADEGKTIPELEQELKTAEAAGGGENQTNIQRDTSALSDFSWAVSAPKLHRARAHVNATQPGLKGSDLAKAIKDRYVEIGGLLRTEQDARQRSAKSNGRVKNMADDDGSDD